MDYVWSLSVILNDRIASEQAIDFIAFLSFVPFCSDLLAFSRCIVSSAGKFGACCLSSQLWRVTSRGGRGADSTTDQRPSWRGGFSQRSNLCLHKLTFRLRQRLFVETVSDVCLLCFSVRRLDRQIRLPSAGVLWKLARGSASICKGVPKFQRSN